MKNSQEGSGQFQLSENEYNGKTQDITKKTTGSKVEPVVRINKKIKEKNTCFASMI